MKLKKNVYLGLALGSALFASHVHAANENYVLKNCSILPKNAAEAGKFNVVGVTSKSAGNNATLIEFNDSLKRDKWMLVYAGYNRYGTRWHVVNQYSGHCIHVADEVKGNPVLQYTCTKDHE
jgi:hypothetical protein